MIIQLAGGCLEWLGHKFPKELSHMVVCMDDTVTCSLCLHDAHHWSSHSGPSVSWCMWHEILGVISWPGHNIFEFSEVHMGVDMSCVIPCWIWSRKVEAFTLVTFWFLFAAGRHPLCMYLQGFGSQGCKDVSEVVLSVWWNAVEEEPVHQGMPEYEEGVIGILGIPVVDGQADGCHPSCQHTSNGIGSGLGRLDDQLLWSQFWGHVSGAGWSDNGQISKTGGRIKNAYISGTVSPIYFKLG